MSYTPTSPAPIRVVLFDSNLLDALHVRLAIDMSPLWCDVQVLGQDLETVLSLRASIRAGGLSPEMILFDCDRLDSERMGLLGAVRNATELKDVPLVVIGDAEEPDSPHVAESHGASAFVRKPMRTCELAGVGREIARIWSECEARRGAA